jgi:hypothetical protein
MVFKLKKRQQIITLFKQGQLVISRDLVAQEISTLIQKYARFRYL